MNQLIIHPNIINIIGGHIPPYSILSENIINNVYASPYMREHKISSRIINLLKDLPINRKNISNISKGISTNISRIIMQVSESCNTNNIAYNFGLNKLLNIYIGNNSPYPYPYVSNIGPIQSTRKLFVKKNKISGISVRNRMRIRRGSYLSYIWYNLTQLSAQAIQRIRLFIPAPLSNMNLCSKTNSRTIVACIHLFAQKVKKEFSCYGRCPVKNPPFCCSFILCITHIHYDTVILEDILFCKEMKNGW